MSDTPKPWADLTVEAKLERLVEADRDLWRHFGERLGAHEYEIKLIHETLKTPDHFSTRGAIFALQSRLDDLCRKLEAMCKALSS